MENQSETSCASMLAEILRPLMLNQRQQSGLMWRNSNGWTDRAFSRHFAAENLPAPPRGQTLRSNEKFSIGIRHLEVGRRTTICKPCGTSPEVASLRPRSLCARRLRPIDFPKAGNTPATYWRTAYARPLEQALMIAYPILGQKIIDDDLHPIDWIRTSAGSRKRPSCPGRPGTSRRRVNWA